MDIRRWLPHRDAPGAGDGDAAPPLTLPLTLLRGRFTDQNAARVLARRVVVDHATHTAWAVTELDARGIPDARAPTCLVFDGASAVRRVWTYPGDWRTLADAEVVALSRGRQARCRRSPEIHPRS